MFSRKEKSGFALNGTVENKIFTVIWKYNTCESESMPEKKARGSCFETFSNISWKGAPA